MSVHFPAVRGENMNNFALAEWIQPPSTVPAAGGHAGSKPDITVSSSSLERVQRQPSSGATWVRMLSSKWVL
jgi:hypothetical protein